MLIFAHIPKTAGTSVVQNLSKHTEVARLYNVPPHELKNQQLAPVVVGHVSIAGMLTHPEVAADDETVVLLSVVRDPVDRLISTYNYVLANQRHPQHDWAKSLSPEACLLEFGAREEGIQTKYLTGAVKWRFVIATLDHVAEAASRALNMAIGAQTTPADFEERFNETSRLQRSDTPRLSRKTLHSGLINYLYDSQHRDLALFRYVSERGIIDYLPQDRLAG